MSPVSMKPEVRAQGILRHISPDVRATGILRREDEVTARVRLHKLPDEFRINAKKSDSDVCFCKWVTDKKTGARLFVTIQNSHGELVGWEGKNTELAKKIDTFANTLFKAPVASKVETDAVRSQNAQSITYTFHDDNSRSLEVDLPRRDDRTWLTKLGGDTYEKFLGPYFGPVRVGITRGGTMRLSDKAAEYVHTAAEALREELDSGILYHSKKDFEARRKLEDVVSQQREELRAENKPVQTNTKTAAIETLIKLHKLEEAVLFHESVEVVDGTLQEPLNLSLFAQKKDVIIPVTVMDEAGTRHAISIYYSDQQLYFYDSLGKPIEESGAEPVVKTIESIFAPKGWVKNPFSSTLAIHDGKASSHQEEGKKDCARYSIMFFNSMLKARKKGEPLLETFTNFTSKTYPTEELRTDMAPLISKITDKVLEGKRWIPDHAPTLNAPPLQ